MSVTLCCFIACTVLCNAFCVLEPPWTRDVYTHSAYAYYVFHVHGNIWRQRGFLRADGSPVAHGEAVSALLDAIHLPAAIVIIKCPSHQKTDTLVANGNHLKAAKQAVGTHMGPLLVAEDCELLTVMYGFYRVKLQFDCYCSLQQWRLTAADKMFTQQSETPCFLYVVICGCKLIQTIKLRVVKKLKAWSFYMVSEVTWILRKVKKEEGQQQMATCNPPANFALICWQNCPVQNRNKAGQRRWTSASELLNLCHGQQSRKHLKVIHIH